MTSSFHHFASLAMLRATPIESSLWRGTTMRRVLAFDTAVAQRCARLHVPDRRAERDGLIAVTALVHGMTVVTRNLEDFRPTGEALLNPWDYSA